MSDTVTFKSVEREGWEERADLYDSYTARLTSPAIEALLDAAQISSGQAVLDVCCGTGLASAAAVARGCQVTGVDFSPAMIETARRKQVEAEFEVGDAEELPFPDASFDCVITNYGHYHLPDPDRAIKEAARVLKPSGRYAFTTWCGPDRSPGLKLIFGTIVAHADMDVGLPPAPNPFRLAKTDEVTAVMQHAGFDQIKIGEFPSVIECGADEFIDFLNKATVRATMLLKAQTPEVRARIEAALNEGATEFIAEGRLTLPVPSLVIRGAKL